MLTHHVLFWLKADMTIDQKVAFKQSLEALKRVETANSVFIGTPAPIERAVVDSSYTFSLTVIFDDLAGHNVYQTHPLHLAFLDSFRMYFEKIVIYDAE
ncbi:Dabb family protein [Arcticibacter eurypsychrophilus]|uniref:Dabb family protein n=1 Tax=Arcticibacter eurypsychrophilus TaxID=1434752 RepID=UPI00084D1E9D|nr:Dabb family protein [Arcticibacter eurypsychrophilus]